MLELTESTIRRCFVNASRKEVASAGLPADLETRPWADLDYLGWHDPKFAKRAYVVLPALDGKPIGVMLRLGDAQPAGPQICEWCRDHRTLAEVAFFSARRVGESGRRGNTVGTLICRRFECSWNVRNDPPLPYDGFDQDAARAARIDALRLRVAAFADMLLTGR
ncbi:FBP domain-containing protein [Leucobacter massiliensis]|uniref:Translation elongation factor n=1 Tax=Leucobacter massiliensis TaxID=1686285 RepID=A0A2S9QNN0_9MICO|nr:FBP domain-containing protein [Leucobacter massiliensis]PRI11195.1 translation elongation factor [Leucobacter massiliensis]